METKYKNLADLLVRHSVSLQKGEKVLIDNTEVPDNMTIALVRAVREYGGIPFVQTSQSRVGREIMQYATKEQMEIFMKFSMPKIQEMDAYIAIAGSHNIYETSDVDADIKTMMSKITKPYLDYRTRVWWIGAAWWCADWRVLHVQVTTLAHAHMQNCPLHTCTEFPLYFLSLFGLCSGA